MVALFRVCSVEGSFFAEGGKEDEEEGDGDGDEEEGDAKDVATRFRDRDIGFAVFLGRLYVFLMPAILLLTHVHSLAGLNFRRRL